MKKKHPIGFLSLLPVSSSMGSSVHRQIWHSQTQNTLEGGVKFQGLAYHQ